MLYVRYTLGLNIARISEYVYNQGRNLPFYLLLVELNTGMPTSMYH